MALNPLEARLKALPPRPGAYLFRDRVGTVIYVGKAASLRSRVRSYFGSGRDLPPKLRRMVARVADIDHIITGSEQEAFLLECNLIKRYRPRYNVRLKDDKSYPFIKITVNEDWPQVTFTRRVEEDGSRYFGPFASAGSVRTTLELVKKLFRYCQRPTDSPRPGARPCFDYHIQRCLGACIGLVPREEYRRIIGQVSLFLEGRQEQALQDLRDRMEAAAEALDFERAALLRDQIRAVERVIEGQRIASAAGKDEDVIALARDKDEACVQIFFIRGGKLLGRDSHVLVGVRDEADGGVLASFLGLFYSSAPYVPPVILLQSPPEGAPVLQGWLSQRRGGRVELKAPQRGERRKLVDMVAQNAAQALAQLRAQWLADEEKTSAALEELQKRLGLPRLPRRVECYDISDIRGTSAVGSLVVFQDGRPRTSDYRRFKVKAVAGADDYAMMQEVLGRRFRRLGEAPEGDAWARAPDLALIDGGKGHLHAAQEALAGVGVTSIPLASIAKEHEEVFRPGAEEPIVLPPDSQALYLLQRIRDEAHRFALAYHRRLRQRRSLGSALDGIPGIGPKRKRALLREFGSVRGIKEAPVEEVATVPGMTPKLAERVKGSL